MRKPKLVSVFLVLSFIAGAAGTYASYAQVQASQHRWCAVLVPLDEADSHSKPTTQAGRNLFGDFHNLRREFCG